MVILSSIKRNIIRYKDMVDTYLYNSKLSPAEKDRKALELDRKIMEEDGYWVSKK